jgi:hypothetical protein
MTLDEAPEDIETVGRRGAAQPIVREETTCADTQQAVRMLADAFEHLRKRDPLYGDGRRFRLLAPSPASVPSG